MRKLILLIFIIQQVWAQSVNASLTIYKDGYGLIKQPVSWDLNIGSNTIQYNRLPNGLFVDSPFLDLNKVTVRSQRLDRNVFSSGKYFQYKLGEKVELKLANDKAVSGTLLEHGASQITIRTKAEIQSFNTNNVDYISIKHNDEELNIRPILSWDVYTNQQGTTTGDLVYLSSGFDWNTNYRMILLNNSDKASFIPEAFITNNSNLNFVNLNLSLVEGMLNRVQHQEVKSLMRSSSAMEYAEADMAFAAPVPTNEGLGDYYIYNIPYKLSINGQESITVRLYDARDISYKKTYLFENYERSQKEEPLVVELQIENTAENNLNIPLPQGKIEIFQTTDKDQFEFLGEDYIKQIPKGATAKLTAGRAFDVIGKRKVLNYDKQRKSEEASIEIQVTNTKDVDVSVKLIEKISGGWVIKNESTMYMKEDASTIYFPVTVPAESEIFVTYTYRKEWN